MFHLFMNSMRFMLLKVKMDIDRNRPRTINTKKAFTNVRRVPTHLSQGYKPVYKKWLAHLISGSDLKLSFL